ncbi:MAG: hypothetical protein ABIP94_08260, partial [Planctomycetota bacterium]
VRVRMRSMGGWSRSGMAARSMPGLTSEESSSERLRLDELWKPVAGRQRGPGTYLLDARLVGRDGRVLDVDVQDPSLVFVGEQAWRPAAAAEVLLRDLSVSTNQFFVASIDQLRAMSSGVRWLVVRKVSVADLQSELPRLTALRYLSICDYGAGLDDTIAAVLSSQLSVSDLGFSTCGLGGITPAGWARIAAMPNLRSLSFGGTFDGLEPACLAPFTRLEALSIPGESLQSYTVSPALLEAIVRLPRLRELHVAVDFELLSASAEQTRLLDLLTAMPSLRRLAFAGNGLDAGAFGSTFARSKLEKLQLTDVSLDEDAVRGLVGAVRLRELDLRNVRFASEASTLLLELHQIKRLDVSGTGLSGDILQALRVALPHCVVLGKADETSRSYPVLGEGPSWTFDP